MNKIATVLIAGVIAGSLSISASALEMAKPATASLATASKVQATQKVTTKKESGIKATVKKMLSTTKQEKAKYWAIQQWSPLL